MEKNSEVSIYVGLKEIVAYIHSFQKTGEEHRLNSALTVADALISRMDSVKKELF